VLLDAFVRGAAATGEWGGDGALTAREREIAQLVAEGRSTKAVAGALAISVKTVETHRTSIMRKLGLASLPDLVRYAVRNQLIEP
jgi:DNA-binding CsgD family transcriptional regulator